MSQVYDIESARVESRGRSDSTGVKAFRIDIHPSKDWRGSITFTIIHQAAIDYREQAKEQAEFKAEQERIFNMLADRWEENIGGKSLIRDILDDPAYQLILRMGKSAIGFILRRMQRDGGQFWFGALYYLTGDKSVITDDIAGDYDRMTEAWLSWGHKRGLC